MDVLLKFLFGSVVGKEGDKQVFVKDSLIMFRKTDVVAHSDIASAFRFSPSAGGFVSKIRTVDGMHFYGESVSCHVGTSSDMDKIYLNLMKNGSWWETEYVRGKSKYTVWLVLPKDFVPSFEETGHEWKLSSHSDMFDIVKAEDDASFGW